MNLQGLSQHNQATFPRLSEWLAGGAAFFSPLMRICGGLWLRPLRFTLLRNMSLRRKKRPFGSLLVAQLAAQDFAHGGLGQFGAELDHLGLFVAREVGLAELLDLRFGQ